MVTLITSDSLKIEEASGFSKALNRIMLECLRPDHERRWSTKEAFKAVGRLYQPFRPASQPDYCEVILRQLEQRYGWREVRRAACGVDWGGDFDNSTELRVYCRQVWWIWKSYLEKND